MIPYTRCYRKDMIPYTRCYNTYASTMKAVYTRTHTSMRTSGIYIKIRSYTRNKVSSIKGR